MSQGSISAATFLELRGDTRHAAGCSYGGFSCGYWLVAEHCQLEHWERHITHGDRCACGHEFPGADGDVVFLDISDTS